MSMVFKVLICLAHEIGGTVFVSSFNVSPSLQLGSSIFYETTNGSNQHNSLLGEVKQQRTTQIQNIAQSRIKTSPLRQFATTNLEKSTVAASISMTNINLNGYASVASFPKVSSTVNISSCIECNNSSESDKSFLFMMLGIGIGATFFIFIVSLAVVICLRVRKSRVAEARKSSEFDDTFMSKESIFNSSTLQLHRGLNNDGLELDAYNNPVFSERSAKHVSAHHTSDVPVDINIEVVDAMPTESNAKSKNNLDNETEYGVSVKLIEDWCEDLEDENTEKYKELKNNIEDSVRYIYREKEGFKNVRLKSFRNGSVIADLVLIMLAAVCNPLDVLEMSVRNSILGSFQVDPHFRLVSDAIADGILGSGDTNDGASVTSSKKYVHRKSSEGSFENRLGMFSSDSGLGIDMKERPLSLDDIRQLPSTASARYGRDSGIGSMPELNGSEARLYKSEASVFDDILESSDDQLQDACTLRTEVQVSPRRHTDVPHVALYNFTGESNRELSVGQGEVLYIINKEVSGWVKVRNSLQQRGWIPVSFLVHVSQSQLVDTQETVETLEFFDNVLDQLDNDSESSTSTVSSTESESTPHQADLSNDINSANKILAAPEDNLKIKVKHCKSVYKFDGEDPSEISFAEGELIRVVKMSSGGWWKGQLKDEIGWFPSSYVMPLNEESELQPGVNVSSFGKVSRDERRNTYSDPSTRTRTRPSIYELQNLTRGDQSHQSLQRGSRARKDYANLYVQILKRESNENIPKSCSLSSLQTGPDGSSLDRPLRPPPSPPKDDKTYFENMTEDTSAKTAASLVKKTRSFDEGPPKRTVPLPPTPRLPLAPFSLVRMNRQHDASFHEKESSIKVAPPSRTRYEISQEKPRKLIDIERKESLKSIPSSELAEDLEDS
eukprot:gene975-10745_t